ncbi:NAD(P)-dependent oxidoreductase [Salinispira pacifica]
MATRKVVVFATSFLDELRTHPEDEGAGRKILSELERETDGSITVEYRCDRDPGRPVAPDELTDVVAIIADLERYGADLLRSAGRKAGGSLELITRYGVGYETVDVKAATASGVLVCNTPGANSRPTAEWAVSTLLDVAGRRIPHHERAARGELKVGPSRLDVSGRRLGIVGTGMIGRNVADLLSGFRMDIIAYDPIRNIEWARKSGVRYVELEEIWRTADFITLHASSTTRLIGERELAMMRPETVLVNCARGVLVDPRAVYRAVAEGKLWGYGVDEVWLESDLPLAGLNIAVSPHVGSDSDSGKARMQRLTAETVAAYLRGDRPASVLNPELLAGG